MNILYKSFHLVDVDNERTVRNDISEDFDSFINDFVDFSNHNEKAKAYVIMHEEDLISDCIQRIVNDTDIEYRNELSDKIALKLLESEKLAQAKIYPTGSKVKRGSLVQALVQNSDDEYDYLIFDKQIDNDHREYIYSMYERRGIEYLKPSFFSADDFFYSNYNSYDVFKYKELEFRKVENALYEKIESMRWATDEVKQRAHSSNITWIQSYDELTIEEKELIEKYNKYITSYVVGVCYKVFHFDLKAIADLIYEEVRGCKVPSYIRKWEEFKLYVLESYKTR